MMHVLKFEISCFVKKTANQSCDRKCEKNEKVAVICIFAGQVTSIWLEQLERPQIEKKKRATLPFRESALELGTSSECGFFIVAHRAWDKIPKCGNEKGAR